MFLVAGATSNTGRRVVDGLLQLGKAVRVMVRAEHDGIAFTSRGASAVVGDVRDADAVERACEGATTVISLVGRHFSRTHEGLWNVDALGNETLVRSAARSGASKFVLLSALWSDRDLPPLLFRAKMHAERALVQSGMRWTILRPSTFVVGASSLVGMVAPTIERWGVAFVPAPDSGPVSFIAEVDVADALVRAAVDDDAPDRAIDLGGPERLTMVQSAERVARAIGRSVRIVRLPRAALPLMRGMARRAGFGAYEAVLFLEMIANVGYDCDPTAARSLLGRELTTADEALRGYYQTRRITPWRETNFGTIMVRGT